MAGIAPAPHRLRDLMTVTSRTRYLAWRAFSIPKEIVVAFGNGDRLMIRRPPASMRGKN
jgi:hypothetical protein